MADRRNERVYPARKSWHGVVFVILLTFKKDFIRTAFTLCGFLFVSLFWAFFLWARRFSVFSGSWAVRLSFSGFFALDSTRRDILPPLCCKQLRLDLTNRVFCGKFDNGFQFDEDEEVQNAKR